MLNLVPLLDEIDSYCCPCHFFPSPLSLFKTLLNKQVSEMIYWGLLIHSLLYFAVSLTHKTLVYEMIRESEITIYL